MKSKLKNVLVLIIIMSCATGIVFAFWAENIRTSSNYKPSVLLVGEGASVYTNVNINDQSSGLRLVPEGVTQENTTTQISMKFPVSWNIYNMLKNDIVMGFLDIELISINGLDDQVKHLINIEFNEVYDIMLSGPVVNVLVLITMDYPYSYTQYQLISNQTFSFTLRFSIRLP